MLRHKLPVAFFAIIFCMTSCQKDETLLFSEIEKTNISEPLTRTNIDAKEFTSEIYMVDDKIVSEKTFQWDVEGMEYHIRIGEKNNPDSETVYYMAFSDKRKYDTFMRSEVGEKYDIHEAITAHLGEYAELSGAVDYLEKNGEIPQFYLEYERAYLQENLPQEDLAAAQQRTIMGFLFREISCVDPFGFSLPLLGTPFFIANNNEASSFEGILIGGWHRGYDKSFYRKKIYNITTWGLTCNSFPSAIDDKMSSWWSVGI